MTQSDLLRQGDSTATAPGKADEQAEEIDAVSGMEALKIVDATVDDHNGELRVSLKDACKAIRWAQERLSTQITELTAAISRAGGAEKGT